MTLSSNTGSCKQTASSMPFATLACSALAQWQTHYVAETVDLRYFFHSGWSS